MELRDYVAIVRRSQGLFLSIVLIATLLVAWLTARQPARFEGSTMLTVFQDVPTQTQPATPYQFDSFYTIQASSLYADQLKSYVLDPGFVTQVFAAAGLAQPDERLVKLARVFTVRKQDPSSLQVQFEGGDQAQVTAVLNQVGTLLKQETTSLQSEGALQSMRVRVSEPVVVEYEPSVLVAAVLAAVASAMSAIALIFLLDFARPRSKR